MNAAKPINNPLDTLNLQETTSFRDFQIEPGHRAEGVLLASRRVASEDSPSDNCSAFGSSSESTPVKKLVEGAMDPGRNSRSPSLRNGARYDLPVQAQPNSQGAKFRQSDKRPSLALASNAPANQEIINDALANLAQASLVAAKMQSDHPRVAVEALALLGIPALMFGDNGKVLVSNELIERLNVFILWRSPDWITLKDARADALLRDALVMADQDAPAVRSFPVRNGQAPMVAHVVPIRRSARDPFPRCVAMLIVMPVTKPNAPSIDLIRSFFGLTRAQARVAHGLAAGKTVTELAVEGGTSRNTVRTHLNAVLAKTGSDRQSDVVGLLSGLRPPGSAGIL